MAGQKFSVGDRFFLKGAEYEIASASLSSIRVMRCRGGQMFEKTPEDMKEFIRNNNIKISSAKASKFDLGVGALPEAYQRVIAKRRAYVETVLENHYAYSSREPNGPQKIIFEVAKSLGEKPPAHSTVCRWIKAFIESQRDITSLCPTLQRRPKTSIFEDWLEKEISHLCDQHYLSDTRMSVISIAHEIQSQLDEIFIELGLHGKVNTPSIRTLQRRIKRTDPMFLLRQKLGKNPTIKKLIASGRSFETYRVFECVEADGNYMDIIIIDKDTGEVIGRVYLTVFIDRFSRHILSYELSLFPFSATTLLSGLKKAYNSDNGLPGGLIEKLVIDNGSDYVSASVKNLINSTGTTIEYAPPYSPNFKPFVERFFRTINTDLIHKLPGTTHSSPKERGSYNSEAKALLTIDELRKAIDEYLEIYHNRRHQGLNDTPSNIMRRMLNRRPVGQISSERLDNIARITKQSSINQGRVTAFNSKWYSHALRTIEHKIKMQESKIKVDVYVDVLDLGTVLVKDPFSDGFITAENTRPNHFNKLSLFEHEKLHSELKAEGLSSDCLSEEEWRKRLSDLTKSYSNSDKKQKRKIAAKAKEIHKKKTEKPVTIAKTLPAIQEELEVNKDEYLIPDNKLNRSHVIPTMTVIDLGED